ncbi:hypothetical protein PV10_06746 [Exophiala mesophila]|uniref:Methyltransferase domain-containing protein n=1 Tax=Exophiala mesophila TaxID=212818 RepID=A0A0D1ZEB4_EXOME|nr:uncharacterized protein PV10_06746 [Exophiala mesophila]KIV92294.1 hypothetical protein PV10_06746 [Exophiala mesophila]
MASSLFSQRGHGACLSLHLNQDWPSEEEYVQSLLTFATGSDIFRNLCGGVHILDFLTREPDLYTTVLPESWRNWFDLVSVDNVLDLLLRSGLSKLSSNTTTPLDQTLPSPPESLLDYVSIIRKHCLLRQFKPISDKIEEVPTHIAMGMKPKKAHEVKNFAAYVANLSSYVSESLQEPIAVVDFGSGQNYLGRMLASPPYEKHVIAIERRHHNIDGARSMDVHARLATKEKIMRNKKEWKRQLAWANGVPTPPPEQAQQPLIQVVPDVNLATIDHPIKANASTSGSMTYVEHDIQDGHLEDILYPSMAAAIPHENGSDAVIPTREETKARPKAMVVSLHSCGNLVHHGLRSLVLNPSVCAVAMIGCCYNLLTERLGPATYKLPQLRPNHPRLDATGNAYDPHGFPMSQTLEHFEHEQGRGVKLNITARMMAVQAPYNWGPDDSEAFFRRHFYRALLQRILLDVGVVKQCSDPSSLAGGSITGKDNNGTPLIVGSLRKACFVNFQAYVKGALEKLRNDPVDGPTITRLTKDITAETIQRYETDWAFAKKRLAIIWSLMAFSAGVVESVIAVDRWLFLREQKDVAQCWVDTVFDYKQSPRNLVVVGIKKKQEDGNWKD